MVSKTPKEDPQAKADRERDRRLATLDRRDSAQQEADDMTTDLRSVYGLSALSMFGRPGVKTTPRQSVSSNAFSTQSIFRERGAGGTTQRSSPQLDANGNFIKNRAR